MVAAKPHGQAPVAHSPTVDDVPRDVAVDTLGLSVRRIRELMSAIGSPDPAFISGLAKDPRVTVRRMAYRCLKSGGDLAANEDVFRDGGVRYLAGADEAGRGALAGPLVAAAVMFAPGVVVEDVDDSKSLSPGKREEVYGRILSEAISVSVAFIDPGLIDRWGIQLANRKALGDAIAGVDPRCQRAICDHFSLSGCGVPVFGIPMADATFHSVAAASIIAKVERDRVMRSLHRRFPAYNFIDNKGYGTEDHLRALKLYGPCEIHRLTFSSVLPDEEKTTLWEQ